MKLLYAIMDKDCYVVESSGQEVRMLTSETEVNTGYGFESPEPDNQWIFDHCGIRAYRKYIYFAGDYCVAVFEPAGGTQLNHGFKWTATLPGDSDISATLLLARKNNKCTVANVRKLIERIEGQEKYPQYAGVMLFYYKTWIKNHQN